MSRRRTRPAAPDPEELIPAPEEPGITLGELLGEVFGDPEEPTLPGFEMADEPIPSPAARSYSEATNERAKTQDIYGNPVPEKPPETPKPKAKPKQAAQTVLTGEILAPSRAGGVPRYESRIRILDAWQYSGSVATAPEYIDRNWIGWAGDYDRLRELEPGPCIRVPLAGDDKAVTLCRIGDYVVHEEIIGDDGHLEEKIEVWEQAQFKRLFLPKAMAVNT